MKLDTTRPSCGFTGEHVRAFVGVRGKNGTLTARPVGVEDARDAHVDAILVVVAIGQRLSDALAFIVACAWADGVDVAPAVERVNGRLQGIERQLTSLRAVGVPRDRRKPLIEKINSCPKRER